MKGRRRAGTCSIKVTLCHLSTSLESTQYDVLIQTLKLEWKWYLASCETCSVVVLWSWTTAGLVIHLGLCVIHNMDHFSATVLQVFSVCFTTVNYIIM